MLFDVVGERRWQLVEARQKTLCRIQAGGGYRQLNKVLHTAAKTQVRLPGPGRDYYQRRRGEGETNAEALRGLKRHITTTVYRTLQADAAARAARRAQVSEEDRRS